MKFVETPSWLTNNRPMTIGNTILIPEGYNELMEEVNLGTSLDKLRHYQDDTYHSMPYTTLAEEEVPHVAQMRDMGLFRFLGRYGKDFIKTGFKQGDMYKDEDSLEGFHMGHGGFEKEELWDRILKGKHKMILDEEERSLYTQHNH